MGKVKNDAVLYTGSSSSSFATKKAQPKVSEKTRANDIKRSKLVSEDAGIILIDFLDEYLAGLNKTENIDVKTLLASGIPYALEKEMLGNEKAMDILKKAKTALRNIMRDNKNV